MIWVELLHRILHIVQGIQALFDFAELAGGLAQIKSGNVGRHGKIHIIQLKILNVCR